MKFLAFPTDRGGIRERRPFPPGDRSAVSPGRLRRALPLFLGGALAWGRPRGETQRMVYV